MALTRPICLLSTATAILSLWVHQIIIISTITCRDKINHIWQTKPFRHVWYMEVFQHPSSRIQTHTTHRKALLKVITNFMNNKLLALSLIIVLSQIGRRRRLIASHEEIDCSAWNAVTTRPGCVGIYRFTDYEQKSILMGLFTLICCNTTFREITHIENIAKVTACENCIKGIRWLVNRYACTTCVCSNRINICSVGRVTHSILHKQWKYHMYGIAGCASASQLWFSIFFFFIIFLSTIPVRLTMLH